MNLSDKTLPPTVLSLLFIPLAALASDDDVASKKEQRAYVETSYLIAPRQAGDFVLEGTQFDKKQKYSGAGFRYRLGDHQESRIDVFVYPAGRMGSDQALERGMQAFRADLKRAVDAGSYSNLVLADEQDFATDGEPTLPVATPAADDKEALLQGIVSSGKRWMGRKLPMTLDLQPQGWPMHSRGYLFYKQLYYYKIRASAAQERISSEEFDRLTDLAARTLVPAIEVVNVGACADSTIYLDKDATPEEAAQALVTQAVEHQGYNCHASAADAALEQKSATASVIDISYEPEEWRSE